MVELGFRTDALLSLVFCNSFAECSTSRKLRWEDALQTELSEKQQFGTCQCSEHPRVCENRGAYDGSEPKCRFNSAEVTTSGVCFAKQRRNQRPSKGRPHHCDVAQHSKQVHTEHVAGGSDRARISRTL